MRETLAITFEMAGDLEPRTIRGVEDALVMGRQLCQGVAKGKIEFRNARIRLGWFLRQVKSQLEYGEFEGFLDRLGGNRHTLTSSIRDLDGAEMRDLKQAGVSKSSMKKAVAVAKVFAGDDGRPDPRKLAVVHRGAQLRELEKVVGVRRVTPAERESINKMRAKLGVPLSKAPEPLAPAGMATDVGAPETSDVPAGGSGTSSPTFGPQLDLASLYENAAEAGELFDDYMSRFDHLDGDERARFALAVEAMTTHLSFSSTPVTPQE